MHCQAEPVMSRSVLAVQVLVLVGATFLYMEERVVSEVVLNYPVVVVL
jgi:hypothetical protein